MCAVVVCIGFNWCCHYVVGVVGVVGPVVAVGASQPGLGVLELGQGIALHCSGTHGMLVIDRSRIACGRCSLDPICIPWHGIPWHGIPWHGIPYTPDQLSGPGTRNH